MFRVSHLGLDCLLTKMPGKQATCTSVPLCCTALPRRCCPPVLCQGCDLRGTDISLISGVVLRSSGSLSQEAAPHMNRPAADLAPHASPLCSRVTLSPAGGGGGSPRPSAARPHRTQHLLTFLKPTFSDPFCSERPK